MRSASSAIGIGGWLRCGILASAALAILVLPGSTRAQVIGLTGWSGSGSSGVDNNNGFEFSASSPIRITELGYFDSLSDGLAVSHAVGIWRVSDQALMVTGTVPAGTTAPLDGQYRYVAVTQKLLAPGSYVVSAVTTGENFLTNLVSPVMSAPLTFVWGRNTFPQETASLVYPNQGGGNNHAPANFKFAAVPPGATTYEYDALDRVTKVTYGDGSSVAYAYDPAGNILSQTVPEPGVIPMLAAGSWLLGVLDARRRRRKPGSRAHTSMAIIALLVLTASASHGQVQRAELASAWTDAVRERIEAAEYEARFTPVRLREHDEAWQAPNRAHNFRAHFVDDGIRVTPREETDAAWELGLSLSSYGRGAEAVASEPGSPRADGHKVEYRRGGIAEWFVNDPRGIEQGFTLGAPPRRPRGEQAPGLGARDASPEGDPGPAYLALRVDGDARPVLAADRQSVDFVRPPSPIAVAHYAKLEVRDATGRVLESWMELFRDVSGRGIRLVFDDTDAQYPVEVDPLLTSPAWSIAGNQSTAGLGFAVTGAGDVNGDGFDDALVGVPFFDGGVSVDSGRAYLYLGAPGGLSQVPAWFAIGESPLGTRAPGPTGARFGYAVAGAGDVDDDGFDDFLVSRTPEHGDPLPGQVFLYRGSPTGPADVADWTLEGRSLRRLGQSIAVVGEDFNGDAFADVVIGEAGGFGSVHQGRVYVFYGQADTLLGGGQRCTATPTGSPGVTCNGSALGPGIPAPTVWGETETFQEFGRVVTGAGDLDCDGFGDLVVGQPMYDSSREGRVLVYLGSATGVVSTAPEATFVGSSIASVANVELGKSLAAAGVLDENDPDACGDVLVGAPGRGTGVNGASAPLRVGGIYRIRGTTSGLTLEGQDGTAVPLIAGSRVGEQLGASLANVGDLNGDGDDDFLVGAPGEPGQASSPGRAYLFLLGNTQLTGWPFPVPNIVWKTDGVEPGDYLGAAVAGLGDVNGDALGDLVIGSPSGRVEYPGVSVVQPTGPGSAFAYHGALTASLASLLGLSALDSYAWSGDLTFTPIATTDNDLAAGVGAGPNPDSLVISTGLADDAGRGATDLNRALEWDNTLAAMVLDVPPGAQTLRFTTQYVTADSDFEPRSVVFPFYEYGETVAGDVAGPPGFDDSSWGLVLETPIAEAGRGATHNPISHAIDVTGESTVGLKFRIQEVADSAPDAALLLSRVFFTDVPLPAHLPDPCATPGPSNPDRNGNCIVDNVTNPLPSDLSRTAGSFRYSQTLLDVPGKLLPFELTITYSSDRTREDQLGPKWSHNFDSTLEESPDFSGNTCPDSVYVWTGGGNVEVYKETDATINVPPVVRCEYEPLYPGIYSKLTADPCCGVAYRYDTKDNFFSDFNPETPGSTKHRRDFIAHPNAQAIFITYDPATGQVDYVTDSRGEQYNFIYDDGFTPARLVSVSGPGAEISFGYDGLGFLSTVTDPNGLTTTFTYDGDGKILTVTDADGNRIVTNEYESAGGLGVDQSGDRIVRQENANPGDPGLTKAYTGDSVGTQGRTDGRSKERYDVFGRVVQRLVLLDSTPPNSLDACDVAVPANTPWCAVTKLAYNEQNLVAEEIDPRGVVTQFEYNAKGDVTCRTEDALGTPYRTGFNHDGRNNVVARLVQRDAAVLPLCPPPTSVSQAAPLANLAPGEAAKWLVTLVQYNVVPLPYDLLTGRVDPLGRLTTFTRYPQAAPGSTEPLRGLLQAVTNAVGATLGFTYDSLGHPRTETGPLGEVTQYTYDLLGQRTSRTDPRGNTWLTSYDAGGRLVFQADPLFNLETYTYDARGNVLTRTDPADAVWQSTYTPTGQDETTADPLGNAVAFEYDAEDRLTVVTNPRGFETRRSYDAAGRLASLTDAQGNVSTFEHDRAGNLTAMTNALGRRTEFDYDARGRRTATRNALDLAGGTQTTFTYDTRGNLLTATRPHPLGPSVLTQSWTDTDVLASVADPTGVTTTFTYDLVDQLDVRTQVERGLETDHDWDLAGRLTDVTMSTAADGVLATSAAAYDVASNNVSVTDPNGNLIEFEFDALNRVVLERDGEGNEVGWGYDERSLLERRTNARHVPVTAPSQLTFTYDAAERRIQTAGQEPGYSWTIDDTLDANGNATASTGASTDPARAPATVSRSFDALDQEAARTVELTAGLQRTVTSEYDELGNLAAVIYSDGTTRVDYTYDALNRITSVTYSGAGPAQQTTYEYDAVDNVTRVVQPDGSETLFSYDLADRPTEITDQVGGNVLFGAQFTLDAAGRRVAAELQLPLQPTLETDETFAYDAANRLVTRGGSEALVYDADGNLVSGRIGGTTRSLSYNAKNQLVGFDGDVYRYDADGNCVARSSGAVTTYYLYDSLGRLVEELDATGAVIARYVHGLGLISRQAGAATSIYHYDSRGSTVALTDLSGAITDRYAYTPFGGVQLDAANATPNRFTYGGRDGVFDEGNGLYATRSRHYAPELMRFVQKDKVYAGRVDGPQSMNRYAFVEGNPIERIDPTGAKGIGSALKIARRAAKKANKSETMGEKLRSEAFDQFAAEYLTKEGYTAEQVGYVCDKVGGGVCDWLGGADRYVSGLFKPVYAAAHGVIFGAQREVMDAACDVTDLPYCDELGSGVRWFQDLIAENVQETLDAGLFGFFAEERDTLVGLWETGHEVYLSLVDLISPRAGDALREIEEIARDIFESIF